MRKSIQRLALPAITIAAVAATAVGATNGQEARNVILMISDGAGFNTFQAASYYDPTSAQVYDRFGVRLAMQTNSANNPAGYNPARMAANFDWAKSGATDSASAATAMYTGVKINDGVINMTTTGQPLTTFFERAAAGGRSIGAVSTVEFTHATPAAVFGHNTSRNNYSEMAREAVYGSNPNSHNANYDDANYNGNLRVVMGTGHPDFNADGQPQTPDYRYVGGADAWTDLQNGTNGWNLVETTAQFEALTSGATPDRVFGVAQNISTLQQGRTNPAGNFDPLTTNVPTLATMSRAALNVLDNNANGFAVMIEGGAVDWAGHANQADRLIEEQIDFNRAVGAVIDWIDVEGDGIDWTNTLLIVTADHETGYLWGDPNAGGSFVDVNGNGVFDTGVDYRNIQNNGAGVLPGMAFSSGNHTNQLVPLFAMGAGSEALLGRVIGNESNLNELYNLDGNAWNGDYIDNTSIFSVMSVPEPGSVSIIIGLGAGALALLRRRKAQA